MRLRRVQAREQPGKLHHFGSGDPRCRSGLFVREVDVGKREIKFRYWDGEMMHRDRDGWPNDLGINAMFTALNDYGYAVLQYTGVKDVNGMEIYQGDYLRYHSDIFVVIWQEFSAAFEMAKISIHDGKILFCRPLNTSTYCKVIGNIYENPELLEKENIDVKEPAAA